MLFYMEISSRESSVPSLSISVRTPHRHSVMPREGQSKISHKSPLVEEKTIHENQGKKEKQNAENKENEFSCIFMVFFCNNHLGVFTVIDVARKV